MIDEEEKLYFEIQSLLEIDGDTNQPRYYNAKDFRPISTLTLLVAGEDRWDIMVWTKVEVIRRRTCFSHTLPASTDSSRHPRFDHTSE